MYKTLVEAVSIFAIRYSLSLRTAINSEQISSFATYVIWPNSQPRDGHPSFGSRLPNSQLQKTISVPPTETESYKMK